MKEITPTNNSTLKIIVDDEDYPILSRYKWYIGDTGYAMGSVAGNKHTKMHKLIMGNPTRAKLVIDHRNRNKLDNRKKNLRWVTQKQNTQNRDSVGYCYDANRDKYMVRYKNKFYGRYDTAKEAARAVRLARSGVEYQTTRRKNYMLPKHISKQFGKYVVSIQKDGKRYRKVGLNTLEDAISWRDNIYKQLEKED